jgi:metal transporter CNNM
MDSILVIEILILIGLSAVCSGLNVSLMSLNVGDLGRRAKLGEESAARILPLRRNSHLSLAAILLTNVAVISTTSLILERHYNGLVAGIASTLLIVVFGEIFPQALFTRHAMSITSRFAPFLRFLIICTYPISKPLQLLLDRLFGHEATRLHSRRELGIILTEQLDQNESELDKDEIDIMKGALSLSEKRVREIMTPIESVFWVTPHTILDGAKIDEIKSIRWSRIPVLSADMTHTFGMLHMKDLVDINFDNQTIRVDDLPLHHAKMVGIMTALDTLFRRFISTSTHLMLVERDERIVGIVTIEDLIEEIIGQEIEDEADEIRGV